MAIGFNSNLTNVSRYSGVKVTDTKKQGVKDGKDAPDTNNLGSSYDTAVVYERSITSVNYSTEKDSKSSGYGKTVGEPNLSSKAAEYYDKLKSKYGNMDFILVSKDMKDTAKSMASSFANPNRMVVLIDEEKIERMATDDDYRKQYEGLISMSQSNIPKLKEAFATSENVKGYGIQVNDGGTATLFAVVKKSSQAQAERIKKAAEEKKAEKKEEEKKAEKKEKEEELEEKLEAKKEEAVEFKDLFGYSEDDEYEIITASSMEELLSKVSQYTNETYDVSASNAQMSYAGGFDFKA